MLLILIPLITIVCAASAMVGALAGGLAGTAVPFWRWSRGQRRREAVAKYRNLHHQLLLGFIPPALGYPVAAFALIRDHGPSGLLAVLGIAFGLCAAYVVAINIVTKRARRNREPREAIEYLANARDRVCMVGGYVLAACVVVALVAIDDSNTTAMASISTSWF